jgi:hypothetical protein
MKPRSKKPAKPNAEIIVPIEQPAAGRSTIEFVEVLALIEAARERAYQAVNTELVGLYWQLGEYISNKIVRAEWGTGVVDELALTIAREYPGLRGFARPNLLFEEELAVALGTISSAPGAGKRYRRRAPTICTSRRSGNGPIPQRAWAVSTIPTR